MVIFSRFPRIVVKQLTEWLVQSQDLFAGVTKRVGRSWDLSWQHAIWTYTRHLLAFPVYHLAKSELEQRETQANTNKPLNCCALLTFSDTGTITGSTDSVLLYGRPLSSVLCYWAVKINTSQTCRKINKRRNNREYWRKLACRCWCCPLCGKKCVIYGASSGTGRQGNVGHGIEADSVRVFFLQKQKLILFTLSLSLSFSLKIYWSFFNWAKVSVDSVLWVFDSNPGATCPPSSGFCRRLSRPDQVCSSFGHICCLWLRCNESAKHSVFGCCRGDAGASRGLLYFLFFFSNCNCNSLTFFLSFFPSSCPFFVSFF